MGAGAWPGSDARREGPVRSRAPDVTRPFRWRDLMDEPASGGAGPAAGQKPSDQASILDPAGELHAAADDCVHCGFCLPACPTYQLWGEEMDSPRGRIHLITQILDGAQASEAAVSHLDRCLGCMACLPACPSGVRYDRLIEAARTWTEEPQPGAAPVPARSPRERAVRAAIFATFPYPRSEEHTSELQSLRHLVCR